VVVWWSKKYLFRQTSKTQLLNKTETAEPRKTPSKMKPPGHLDQFLHDAHAHTHKTAAGLISFRRRWFSTSPEVKIIVLLQKLFSIIRI